MSVVIETTLGDITVDLYLDQRPVTCLNFLKLCKMKYYNFNLFHSIRSGFIAQTGDPTGEGSGGQSIFGVLEGPEKRFFSGEKMPKIRHTDTGLMSMVCTGDTMVGSQFFFTLASDLDSLDGVHCVIGEVTEGHEVLRKLNDVICDETHRPYRDVRITHTVVLEDPFSDPPGLRAPSRSPSPNVERLKGGRIAPDEEIDETQGKSVAEIQEIIDEKEAKARATILEIIGDLPDADIAPPENVLFVCKLNPVTTDDDLEIIFSRFGKIVSCEVIRDKKSGDSLQYAFIEFADKKSCEDAYFKMDNVLIDDRRIHVDFSQSVSKIKWLGKGRGVKHLNDDEVEDNHTNNVRSKRSRSRDRVRKNGRDHYSNRESISDRKVHDNMDKRQDEERHRDRQRKSDKESERHYRDRSMSKSKDEFRHERNHTHSNSRYSEKHGSDKKHDLHKHENNKDHRNSHRSKKSPSKSDKPESSSRRDNHKSEHVYKRDNNEKYSRKERSKEDKSYTSDRQISKLKRKNNEVSESHKESKKSKSDHKLTEPRTPSPIEKVEMGEKKRRSAKLREKVKQFKKIRNNKKKRKPSTSSSDSDSSESSSSSDSTSSSDRDRKKSLKRRKKKYTSSSSSSESSSSTSSSDSSSSSTSSSESESGKRKRRKGTVNKKKVKKPKNKL